VPNATIRTKVHQSLDVHRYLSTQITLDREIGDSRTQLRYFWFRKVFDLRLGSDSCHRTNLFCPGQPNAEDRRQ